MKTPKDEYNNKTILDKLVDSCLYLDASLFWPYLQSEKVKTDMPTKNNFYSFFQRMLITAKLNSVEPMIFKIENPYWEEEENTLHYNLYDSVHLHPRLSILVKEDANEIHLDIMPF